jgi:hypothetical protein
MRMFNCVAIVMSCFIPMVVGCGVMPSGESEDSQRVGPPERTTMALEAHSEGLVDITTVQAALNAACPAPRDCQSLGYHSCASWTPITTCGTKVCGGECTRCFNPKNPVCVNGVNRSTFTYQSRTCFNAQGLSCNDVQVFTATACQTATAGDCCVQSPGVCGTTG